MTWQDELQNLDAELAAGRISAEEYRQRRDALLGRDPNAAPEHETTKTAEPAPGEESTTTVRPVTGEEPTTAVGPVTGAESTTAARPVTGEEPTTAVEPVTGEESTRSVEPIAGEESTKQVDQSAQQPAQKDPFPPAFSWSDAAKQGPQQPQQGAQPTGTGEETTQVVRPVTPQPPADSSGAPGANIPPPPQWGPPQPPPQHAQWPPVQPQPQQPPWGPVETTGTPWGDGLPGSAEPGDAPWMRQGPEVFEKAGEPGKGKLIAGLSIGAALLVAVIVAAVFFFTSGGEDRAEENRPAAPPPPAPTTSTTKPLPEPPAAKPAPPGSREALVAVPGPPHPWAGFLDVPSVQGPKAGLLQPGVAETALQNGLVDGWFNGTEGVNPKSTLIALKLPDQHAAETVAEKYLADQHGLSEVKELSYRGVPVVSTDGTFRTAYVAHNYAIILDVSGDPAAKEAVRGAFKTLLDQQLAQNPPTVRK